MTSITIWGRPNSNNVKKALWIAAELGLKYKHVLAGLQHGVNNTPEYLALNPNGVIPTLQDGDFVLWESNAIVRYLAAEYAASSGHPELWPASARTRAEGDKWMDWTSSTFAGVYRDVFWGFFRTAPAERDMELINGNLAKVNKLMAIVDAQLAKTQYLSGSEFGVGDIPLGCFIYTYFNLPVERPNLPNLERWYNDLQKRKAYQDVVMLPID
ncbi:Glutathione S-transferase GstB [Vanrija pseudolonga]|uniref:Glutathione S-transferase GstB n=1 Tax=Vanrija pseudolonga TaxID=143232 RepID=A0AAF0YCJ9_9TREE|nr:Glutathione S-transferase GstB [Vanrija pseudolonga]